MFRKLVSNLPFQPALLDQVSFYLRRMHQEQALRRIGFALTAAVVVLQVFAIVSPAKPSLATSAADIVYGATSRQDVLQAYKNNRDQIGHTDIKAIFDHYGIGASQISSAKLVTIKDSDDRNYINTSRSTTRFDDTFVKIPGASDGGIYEFPLSYWRQGEFPNGYPALTGMSTYGFRFWILLKGCGNIVIERGSKKPALEIVKQRTTPETVAPDGAINYSIQFRNNGAANANSVVIKDRIPSDFVYQSYTSSVDLNLTKSGQQLTWKIANKSSTLAPSSRWHTITLQLKAKSVTVDKRVCNVASIDATNSATVSTSGDDSGRCVTITAPVKPTTPQATPKPTPQKTTTTTTVTKTTPTTKSTTRISTDKKVSNLTQNKSNANNTTANPGDVLRYTLIISNSGNAPATNFSLSGEYGENIADILEYANISDLGDAQFNETTKVLSWAPVTIPAGGEVKKTFAVTIKNPLPATPISVSNPLSFDYVLTNKYGRTVTVKLKKPANKVIEQTATTLPQTGPGSGLIIGAVLITIIGYFFFRSRLLSKELEIVHHEFSSGGL